MKCWWTKQGLQIYLKGFSPCWDHSPASCGLLFYRNFLLRYICDILDFLSFKMGILPVWLKLWDSKKVLVESWAELMCLDWNRLRISTVTALIDSLRLFDEHQSIYMYSVQDGKHKNLEILLAIYRSMNQLAGSYYSLISHLPVIWIQVNTSIPATI